MAQKSAPQPAPEPQRAPSDPGGILRIGFWNYVMMRWAPRNRLGRLIFEMTFLIIFFGILAVLLLLARG
jgi:hypothetical protein